MGHLGIGIGWSVCVVVGAICLRSPALARSPALGSRIRRVDHAAKFWRLGRKLKPLTAARLKRIKATQLRAWHGQLNAAFERARAIHRGDGDTAYKMRRVQAAQRASFLEARAELFAHLAHKYKRRSASAQGAGRRANDLRLANKYAKKSRVYRRGVRRIRTLLERQQTPDVALGIWRPRWVTQALKTGGGDTRARALDQDPRSYQLFNFARSVGARTLIEHQYFGLEKGDLAARRFLDVGLEKGVEYAVSRGRRIHFDLTGLDLGRAFSRTANSSGGGITGLELRRVLSTPRWLRKTTFYYRGKPLNRRQTRLLVDSERHPSRLWRFKRSIGWRPEPRRRVRRARRSALRRMGRGLELRR
jgi:hypothetical protein